MSEKPAELVRKLISKYIPTKPRKITLKLDWDRKASLIEVMGENIDEKIEYKETVDFTSFAKGVIEAYKQAYGELKVIPVSFREEIYENDKVSLNLYPTGNLGIFEIFIDYET